MSSFHDRLEQHRGGLRAFVRRIGGGVMRFESLADLEQGVMERALRSDPERRADDERFGAWLRQIARHHIADRADYWRAERRGAAKLVRWTVAPTDSQPSVSGAPAQDAGPATIAERRDLLELAVRIVDALPARDRQLIRMGVEGVSLEEQGRQLDLSYAAVQRAATRARERFRKAFELALRRAAD